MKTSCVYVITSDDKDPFLEQLYLSMFSLRKYSPSSNIIIVTDTATAASFYGFRKVISDYADNVVVAEVPEKYDKMQRSRFIKTSLRELVKGDYLYIDSDTIVADDLSSIDHMESPLMAVPDFHCSMKNHPAYKALKQFCDNNSISLEGHEYWFNGGLMYAKDDPIVYSFYSEWHKEWKRHADIGCPTDQQSLLVANGICGFPIKKLGNEWNCQILYNGLRYLSNAKIIHYFASGLKNSSGIEQPYVFQNKKHYNYIKETGNFDEECITNLENPKGAFIENVQISTQFLSSFNNTPFYAMMRNFYYNNPKLIKFLSKIKHLFK